MTKIVLVSGCAGFLGTHLCLALLKKRYSVFGIDNFITGSRDNLNLLLRTPNFTFLEADICKKEDWFPHFQFIPIDEIYHLASIASPEHYTKYSLETIDVNTIGTRNLLDLAVLHNSSFLLTSTSEVYGDPEEHPQKESYKGSVNTYGVRACYDESKRLAETIVFEYRKKYNVNSKIVRIFNTYGTFMNLNDKRVIIEFVKNALTGKPLVIHGSGEQTRSFCYADDMIRGLLLLMDSDLHEPVNIGNDKTEVTINRIGEIIIEMTGSNSKIEYVEKLQDDPYTRKPDITIAREKLKWEPKISIEEGLRRTIDWVSLKINIYNRYNIDI